MNTEIKEMLEEEIMQEIEDLATLKIGTDEKSKAVDDLTKLYKLHIEKERMKLDFEEKSQRQIMDNKNTIENRNCEDNFRKEQFDEQRKERYVRIGIAVGEIVLPLMFYAVWMRKGFEFEKEGTYTSTTFKGLFNRFRPTKK